LGAKPYLCTSTDIEETPLTEKSKGGIGYLGKKRLNMNYISTKNNLQQGLHIISNITEPLSPFCVGRVIGCVIQLI